MAKRIGEYLVERGLLTTSQVQDILDYSRQKGLRFGDAGLEMGVLTRQGLIKLFGKNYATDFFHVEAAYFPQTTREVFAVDVMLRLGALPLGMKRQGGLFGTKRLLNVGLLDPSDRAAVAEVERLTLSGGGATTFDGVKVYLILADQFLEVLCSAYGLAESEIRKREAAAVSGTLALYLESFDGTSG